MGSSGILRSVLLVVVRIMSSDDRSLLMQIAEADDYTFVPKCVLPGGKIREGETAAQAAKRMIDTDLARIKSYVTLNMATGNTRETKMSPGYGMNTMYIKTHFCAD